MLRLKSIQQLRTFSIIFEDFFEILNICTFKEQKIFLIKVSDFQSNHLKNNFEF